MSDIARLFQEDPLKLTRTGEGCDMDLIIKRYREARHQFNIGEKSAGATKKIAGPKGPKVQSLDLKDLLG